MGGCCFWFNLLCEWFFDWFHKEIKATVIGQIRCEWRFHVGSLNKILVARTCKSGASGDRAPVRQQSCPSNGFWSCFVDEVNKMLAILLTGKNPLRITVTQVGMFNYNQGSGEYLLISSNWTRCRRRSSLFWEVTLGCDKLVWYRCPSCAVMSWWTWTCGFWEGVSSTVVPEWDNAHKLTHIVEVLLTIFALLASAIQFLMDLRSSLSEYGNGIVQSTVPRNLSPKC